MTGTLTLVAATVSALAVLSVLWRAGRRAVTDGAADSGTVSRQWLVEHQSDDHP
jgi:hypothetical protein